MKVADVATCKPQNDDDNNDFQVKYISSDLLIVLNIDSSSKDERLWLSSNDSHLSDVVFIITTLGIVSLSLLDSWNELRTIGVNVFGS